MNHELKPCPFCGSEDLQGHDQKDYITCNTCTADGPMGSESDFWWNDRATYQSHSSHESEIEALARDMMLARASIPNYAIPFADCFSDAEGFIRHRNARRLERATTNSAETDTSEGQ